MKAYCPGNISCIFRPYRGDSPATTGSLGMGITVCCGLTASVQKGHGIYADGKKVAFPTVQSVLNHLGVTQAKVDLHAEVPFGCGFGMSGAAALATAYAANAFFGLKKKSLELAMVAHVSEVEQKTGLGDVSGQYLGGILMKLKKGDPLAVERIPIRNRVIYYRIFGPIATKEVITGNKLDLIDKAGKRALAKLQAEKKPTLEKILAFSYDFAMESKLLSSTRLHNCIEEVRRRGGQASMIMLGESMMSTIPFGGSQKATITRRGIHLL